MDKNKFYIGEDGLEYCAVCQEPVEKELPEHVQAVFGMKTHPRQCACMRKQMEKEKRERKEREHQQEVEKNTAIYFLERAMREWNFKNDDGSNPHMKYAKQYVEHGTRLRRKEWKFSCGEMWEPGRVTWLHVLLMCYLRKRREF